MRKKNDERWREQMQWTDSKTLSRSCEQSGPGESLSDAAQARGPEFVLLGAAGLRSVRAAGFWGPDWGFDPQRAVLDC